MAIQFVSVKCPQCSADLSIESGRQQVIIPVRRSRHSGKQSTVNPE